MLDLYAGSGAVGIEALSRGAAHVLLVEAHAGAAQVIRDNARTLALRGAAVLTCPVERLVAGSPTAGALARGARAPYDIAFLDPLYDLEDTKVRAVLDGLRAHGWLAEAAVRCGGRPPPARAPAGRPRPTSGAAGPRAPRGPHRRPPRRTARRRALPRRRQGSPGR